MTDDVYRLDISHSGETDPYLVDAIFARIKQDYRTSVCPFGSQIFIFLKAGIDEDNGIHYRGVTVVGNSFSGVDSTVRRWKQLKTIGDVSIIGAMCRIA